MLWNPFLLNPANNSTTEAFFFKFFVGPRYIFWGHWLPLWASPGFQSQGGSFTYTLACLHVVNLRAMSGAAPAFSTNGVYTVQAYIQQACPPDIHHESSRGQATIDANFWQQWDSILCCCIDMWMCYPLGLGGWLTTKTTTTDTFVLKSIWPEGIIITSNLFIKASHWELQWSLMISSAIVFVIWILKCSTW